jgi:hypothetical protein
MEPECRDRSYPLFNKVSLPRMITAQFDQLNTVKVIDSLSKKVLKNIEQMLISTEPKYWFTAYVAVFAMLHEIAVTSRDRHRHAMENRIKVGSAPAPSGKTAEGSLSRSPRGPPSARLTISCKPIGSLQGPPLGDGLHLPAWHSGE